MHLDFLSSCLGLCRWTSGPSSGVPRLRVRRRGNYPLGRPLSPKLAREAVRICGRSLASPNQPAAEVARRSNSRKISFRAHVACRQSMARRGQQCDQQARCLLSPFINLQALPPCCGHVPPTDTPLAWLSKLWGLRFRTHARWLPSF